MQTYKGKYDWKQELRIGTLSKIRICRIRVNEVRIAKVTEFEPKIRLTGINSHH
jgi:hypothetical protein